MTYRPRPILYIEQPELQAPVAPMQEEYQSLAETEQETGRVGKKEPSKGMSKTTARPKFDEMTLEEKIDYLRSPSEYLPKMSCKIEVKDRTYRGKILTREDRQIVLVEHSTNRRHLIELDDIIEINLIGF